MLWGGSPKKNFTKIGFNVIMCTLNKFGGDTMFRVKTEKVKGKEVNYLCFVCDDGSYLVLGYIDCYKRVHFYTSK